MTPDSSVPRNLVLADELTVVYRSASRHQVTAVNRVSFSVPAGSWTVLAGPSGSGKSSLLHVLGGLLTPSSGTLEVAGSRIDGLSGSALAEYRRSTVGFVFQSFYLLPHLRAWENVALPLIASRLSQSERRQRATELLTEVGLATRLHHLPSELSGGEQQRVALARALANGPRLVLADEPTGNLDAGSGREVLDLLGSFARKGTTIVCASHDPHVASRATSILHLVHGELVRLDADDERKRSTSS